MTTGKTIALTRPIFVSKYPSQLLSYVAMMMGGRSVGVGVLVMVSLFQPHSALVVMSMTKSKNEACLTLTIPPGERIFYQIQVTQH